MQFTHLVGAEDVSKAARSMASSVSQFGQHVGYLDESLRQHQMFLDEWLCRFQEALKGLPGIGDVEDREP
jgi:predicted alpha/beta-fold hydrolase